MIDVRENNQFLYGTSQNDNHMFYINRFFFYSFSPIFVGTVLRTPSSQYRTRFGNVFYFPFFTRSCALSFCVRWWFPSVNHSHLISLIVRVRMVFCYLLIYFFYVIPRVAVDFDSGSEAHQGLRSRVHAYV